MENAVPASATIILWFSIGSRLWSKAGEVYKLSSRGEVAIAKEAVPPIISAGRSDMGAAIVAIVANRPRPQGAWVSSFQQMLKVNAKTPGTPRKSRQECNRFFSLSDFPNLASWRSIRFLEL
ncbi:MAG TPA: hypothetical protein VFE47_29765 [Tepidisphaeraceae bacterium]|jgi:hypothetical protein|nr:hypothetical protein [Tepidisphaeraceae bacterium]